MVLAPHIVARCTPAWHIDSCPPNPHFPTPQGGFGSRVPVSLEQCALACKGAPGCDMFTYNQVQQGCFLKTGQCPLRNNCQVGKGVEELPQCCTLQPKAEPGHMAACIEPALLKGAARLL